MEAGQKRQRDREQGQSSLFGELNPADHSHDAGDSIPEATHWSEAERLAHEKESLGFFITGHPLERHRVALEQWATARTGGLAELAGIGEVTVGGIVAGLRLIKTKRGDRMASYRLEDLEGGVEALVFPETYKKISERLADDRIVLTRGKVELLEDGKSRLLVSEVLSIEQAELAGARYVTIRMPMSWWDRTKGERLREILDAHPGDCPVTLELVQPGLYAVDVAPSNLYSVRPDPALRQEVDNLVGPGALVLARTNGRSH